MEDLDSDLTKVEKEISELQASVNRSLRNARDSGIPESRRTTLSDGLGARPKSVRMTPQTYETPVLDRLDHNRDSNRFSSTSTPLDSVGQHFPLQPEDNITRRRPNVRVGFDQRKNGTQIRY